jgi:hypothetical protein
MIVSSGRLGLCALLISLVDPALGQTPFPRFVVCEQAAGYGAVGGKLQALRSATDLGYTSWVRIDTRDGDIEKYTLTGGVKKSSGKRKFSIDRNSELDLGLLYFTAPHETVQVVAEGKAIHFAMTFTAGFMFLYAGTCRPG